MIIIMILIIMITIIMIIIMIIVIVIVITATIISGVLRAASEESHDAGGWTKYSHPTKNYRLSRL